MFTAQLSLLGVKIMVLTLVVTLCKLVTGVIKIDNPFIETMSPDVKPGKKEDISLVVTL